MYLVILKVFSDYHIFEGDNLFELEAQARDFVKNLKKHFPNIENFQGNLEIIYYQAHRIDHKLPELDTIF